MVGVFLHDDALRMLGGGVPCGLGVSCASAAAESGAKIWYQ